MVRAMLDQTVVASVVVSDEGWNSPAPAPRSTRLALASEIAERCSERGTRIVVLPAGFLMAEEDDEQTGRTLALRLAAVFTQRGMALIAGVDLPEAQELRSISDPVMREAEYSLRVQSYALP